MKLIKSMNIRKLMPSGKRAVIWLSVAFNVILIFLVFIFALKYETEVYFSEQFYSKEYSKDSVSFFWPDNKKMGLSITFDDARISQIESGGISILDKYNVKGTFYVSPENLATQIDGWKKAIENGHEIGNHTTTHPCSVNFGWHGRKTLENYSLTDIHNDINTANEIISEILGVQPVSFAYPCGQTFVGMGLNAKSYVPVISSMFESGRLYSTGTVNPVFCDMAQLPAESLDNKSFDEILELIEYAGKRGQWLILTGHDVGEGNNTGDNLISSQKTLEAICQYASDPSNGVWIDNVHNIVSYINGKRNEKPFIYLSEYKKPSGSLYSKLWSVCYISKMKIKYYKYKVKQKLKNI
jgi:peptidoglycan/xylan/chitin deacetylase (PgdA/CDA1 family)